MLSMPTNARRVASVSTHCTAELSASAETLPKPCAKTVFSGSIYGAGAIAICVVETAKPPEWPVLAVVSNRGALVEDRDIDLDRSGEGGEGKRDGGGPGTGRDVGHLRARRQPVPCRHLKNACGGDQGIGKGEGVRSGGDESVGGDEDIGSGGSGRASDRCLCVVARKNRRFYFRRAHSRRRCHGPPVAILPLLQD